VHLGEAEVDQRVDVAVGDAQIEPPLPPSPPSGPPNGRNFSRQERGAAVAAVAGDDFDSCFVDKLHDVTAKN
jgi:hypothetical protein